MIRSIKAAFASKLSIARSILRSSNFASIAIADNSDSLFESRSSRDIPIPATPARLAESPLLESRALALARCIWWSSLFCINSWMMPCFGFLHGARAGCTGQLACARDRRAREKVEDIKTTESQEDDGESRSQGAKEPRAKEKNLSTRPAIPARTRRPPGVHGIIQFTDAHPRFFRRRLELRHALLRLPRAGWISTFLLECLRNAVQPPGSRTYQRDPIV